MNIRINVSANVYPTEEEEKVKIAILNIFPDVELKMRDDVLVGMSKDISALREKLAIQRIRDSARIYLRGRTIGRNKILFKINKQAAYTGIVNFSDVEHPLGDIEVEIECDDVNNLIDYIAPSSIRGECSQEPEGETWEEE